MATAEAERRLALASAAKAEADRQLDRNKHLSYVSSMNLVQKAFDEGDPIRTGELPALWPAPGTPRAEDLQGFD